MGPPPCVRKSAGTVILMATVHKMVVPAPNTLLSLVELPCRNVLTVCPHQHPGTPLRRITTHQRMQLPIPRLPSRPVHTPWTELAYAFL